jgi:hypothetical protein
MDENPGLSDQYRTASPWPLFVALGIPISELGLLFDLFALAVGGLVLFCGSVTGMLREAGYVETPWRALGGFGVALVALGVGLAFGPGYVTRGYAVAGAGVVLLGGAVVGTLFVETRPAPV